MRALYYTPWVVTYKYAHISRKTPHIHLNASSATILRSSILLSFDSHNHVIHSFQNSHLWKCPRAYQPQEGQPWSWPKRPRASPRISGEQFRWVPPRSGLEKKGTPPSLHISSLTNHFLRRAGRTARETNTSRNNDKMQMVRMRRSADFSTIWWRASHWTSTYQQGPWREVLSKQNVCSTCALRREVSSIKPWWCAMISPASEPWVFPKMKVVTRWDWGTKASTLSFVISRC